VTIPIGEVGPDPTTAPVTGINPDETARAAQPSGSVQSYPLELRQGVITGIDIPGGMVDLTLGGDPTVIPGVRHVSNYRPTIGDTVYALVIGPDIFVLDRLNNLGPSVIASANSHTVPANIVVSGTASVFQTNANGPLLTNVQISPSGRALVGVSAWISSTGASGGGALGCRVTGTDADTTGIVVQPTTSLSQITYIGVANGIVAASRVLVYTGLKSGLYTFQCMYAPLNTPGGSFSNRQLWVIPL